MTKYTSHNNQNQLYRFPMFKKNELQIRSLPMPSFPPETLLENFNPGFSMTQTNSLDHPDLAGDAHDT